MWTREVEVENFWKVVNYVLTLAWELRLVEFWGKLMESVMLLIKRDVACLRKEIFHRSRVANGWRFYYLYHQASKKGGRKGYRLP